MHDSSELKTLTPMSISWLTRGHDYPTVRSKSPSFLLYSSNLKPEVRLDSHGDIFIWHSDIYIPDEEMYPRVGHDTLWHHNITTSQRLQSTLLSEPMLKHGDDHWMAIKMTIGHWHWSLVIDHDHWSSCIKLNITANDVERSIMRQQCINNASTMRDYCGLNTSFQCL